MFFPLSAIGFASIIVQILLLRELAAVFNGSELTYGTSLFIWLAATGLGSYICGKIMIKFKDTPSALIYAQLIASLIIPAEIYFARASKILLHIPSGAIPDLYSIFLISIITIAPACLLFGSLFTLGSGALANIGSMYIVESIGAALGGIVFSFALIYFLDPFQIAGVAGAALTFSSLYIYKNFIQKRSKPKIERLAIFALVLAVNLICIYPYGAKLDRYSSQAQFEGSNLIKTVDSIYGRISVIEDKGTYSYFEDGNLAFSTASVPENEEIAGLALIESRKHEKILLIGGGPVIAGTMLRLRDVKSLDYVEMDPKLADVSGGFFAITDDGRFFIKNTKRRYDLILINLGDPVNMAGGRFFTAEFMRQCAEKLAPRGVLALKLSGSADFMGKETRALNSSIFKTISSVFPYVKVIPGAYIYYYASPSNGVLTDDAAALVRRWQRENVSTRYFNALSIPHLVTKDRLDYVRSAIKFDDKTLISTDLHPVSYLYSILVWLSYFPGRANLLFRSLLTVKLGSLIVWIFALAIIFRLAGLKIKAAKNAGIPVIVALIGFNAMALQLLSIYSFEAIYGYIYFMIGVLFAVFMAGLALGSYFTNSRPKQFGLFQILAGILVSIVVFAIYLKIAPTLDHRISKYMITAFSFLFAFLSGAAFPVAVSVYRSKGLANKTGVLYGCDLLGGAVSAVATSLLFIPVFGIFGTLAVPVSFCLAAMLLIFPEHISGKNI
jgi:spermidine synthase